MIKIISVRALQLMKFTVLPIFFLLLISCNDKLDDKYTTNIKIKKNALEIPINNKTSNISRGLQAYSDHKNEFLFNINWGQNSLQLYDIATGDLIKRIFFQIEGDRAVGRIFGFHVHNLDSIFLFNQQSPEIVMIDTANVIKIRIEYNPPKGYSNAFVHNAYFISHPFLKGNKLIVKTHLQGNYQKMTDVELEQKPTSYSINLENGDVELLPQKYPEDYLNKGLKFYEYSMAGNANKIVFSLFGDHRLFYSSTNEGDEVQVKEVKSKYLADELPLFPINRAREETYKYLFASDHYESLIYDQYRNIYYRFAFPQQETENMEELNQLREAPNSFSVIILDENLDVIDEVLFDESKHIPNNVFIGRKGLYISTSHPNNPDNKEDKMVFDLVEL
jgi:hypothetical protein